MLLTLCRGEDGEGVFSYASTAATEAVFGGAAYRFDPRGRWGTGFDRPTYVTPCRLASVMRHEWMERRGRIGTEMSAVRREVRKALGIGRGTCVGSPEAGHRGRILELTPTVAWVTASRFGVVVSEPAYSLQERFQIIVPLLDGGEFEPGDGDGIVQGPSWIRRALGWRAAILAFPLIQSVFQPVHVARLLETPVDPATIDAVDAALVRLFGLEAERG